MKFKVILFGVVILSIAFIYPINYIVYLFPIIFLVFSIRLWRKFGKDELVSKTVEFYPLEEFNSLELGFLYKGEAGKQDVISLLIYLANKGYIKISETEEKSFLSKSKTFKITKLKEYDGNNVNEQIFLDGLFKNNINSNKNEVIATDLKDRFYVTMNKILYNINHKNNKNKIFEEDSLGKKKYIFLLIIITYFLITIPPISRYGGLGKILSALLFSGIGFMIVLNTFFGGGHAIYADSRWTERYSIGSKMLALVIAMVLGGIPWSNSVLSVLKEEPIYFIGYMLGVVCLLGMIICLKYLPKRTSYGNEMLGKIGGFRKFLENVEKDKLEAMVMKDPMYFYNILPYAYALGVFDKWIEKFEGISLQAPSWYDSSKNFDMKVFSGFINTTMASAQQVMSFESSSDSVSS